MNQPSQPVIWELVKGWPPKINDNRNSSWEKHRDGPWSWIHFKVIFTDCTHGKSQINPPFGASSTQECTSCSELKIPVTCKIRLQQLRRNADWKIDVNRVGKNCGRYKDSWLEHPPNFWWSLPGKRIFQGFPVSVQGKRLKVCWFVGLLVSHVSVCRCAWRNFRKAKLWKCSIPYHPCKYFPIHLPGPPNRKKTIYCSKDQRHLML